jgi:pimeloyl-ACP methyl ester carboxylesterase
MSQRKPHMSQIKRDFVIVHGAWTGGWSWERVIQRLHARNHRAFAPTLTGLCERAHLAGPKVNLTTHVKDIANEIIYKDLHDIVLVAHSYGGMVATGVIEEMPERIAAAVFVEAFIPGNNMAFIDLVPGWEIGTPMVAPPPSSPGDYLNEADREWADRKATPQPAGTLTQKLTVRGACKSVPRKVFVVATGWSGSFGNVAKSHCTDESWTLRELACGHDIPIDMPEELAGILLETAQCDGGFDDR